MSDPSPAAAPTEPDGAPAGPLPPRAAAASLALAAAGLAAVWFAWSPRPSGFPLDDAWIHLVYARNLADHGVLGYATGVPGSGCTSPAWALVLGAVHAAFGGLGAAAVVAADRAVGAAFFLATAWASAALAHARTRSVAASVAAAALVAACSALAMAAFSGMEVTACALGLVAAALAVERGRALAAGVAAAWACACRPEAAPAMAVLGVLAARRASWAPRALAALALPSAAVGAAIVAHNLRASGLPLPATFYVKQSFAPAELPGRLATVVLEVYGATAPFLGHVGWLALAGLALPGRRRGDVAPLAVAAAYLAAAAAVSRADLSEAFYCARYFLPPLPLFIVAGVVGASRGAARLPPRARPLALAAGASIAAIGFAAGTRGHAFHLHNDTRNINEVQVRMGRDLARLVPPGARVAVSDAGATRYFSGRETVDLIGLNNLELVRDARAFTLSHPVSHLAIMPAWGVPQPGSPTRLVAAYETQGYSVLPASSGQHVQLVLACTGDGLVVLRGPQGVAGVALCRPAR